MCGGALGFKGAADACAVYPERHSLQLERAVLDRAFNEARGRAVEHRFSQEGFALVVRRALLAAVPTMRCTECLLFCE